MKDQMFAVKMRQQQSNGISQKTREMEHGIKMRTSNMLLAGSNLRDTIRNECRKPGFTSHTHRVMLARVFDIFRIVSFLQHILFLLYIFFLLLLLCLPFFYRIRSFWNSDDTLYGDNFVMCNTPTLCIVYYFVKWV